MQPFNTSPQAIELNPSCSKQAHSNGPGTDPMYESTEPEFTLAVLRFPFVHRKVRMPIPPSLFNRFRATGTNGRLNLGFFWRALRNNLKDHAAYDQVLGIRGKPKRVSLLVGKAQLAGCLKVLVGSSLEWDAGIQ